MEDLAIFGGLKAIKNSFSRYNSIGIQEVEAARSVVQSGVLSKFLGCWDPDFYGGQKVQEFERACESYFGVKHAVSVNSWTSGLICALGAVGIEPGDEVIVTPWTMCATATAILHWNAIPVFADIEIETFNLSPASVINNITPHTRAIMAVDIFGTSCDIDSLSSIAKKYNLKLITDSAQSPGARNRDSFAGTMSDVGGFSLNYHKHIHTGEGGILVTNDDVVCERLQLIRNHGEAVVAGKGVKNISNILGYNFRLGEIEAAIGIEQLKKLDKLVEGRQLIASQLTEGLKNLKGLKLYNERKNFTHAYYVYPMVLDVAVIGVSREKIIAALEAEGVVGLMAGYANVHLLPMYQNKIAYGSNGFPWTSDICKRNVDYKKGICPVAEELHDTSFIGFEMCLHELTADDVRSIIKAFKKVWFHLDKLK